MGSCHDECEITEHYRTVKRAIRKGNIAEPFLAGRYSFSPYMACSHGCVYCDGRAERYYVEGDFERDVVIRRNLPELLEDELPKLREVGFVTVGSGISDAYQPPEIREELMRRSAEILARHPFPVAVLTKSAVVRRDIDLWKQVNARGGFNLYISLTFADDRLRQIFEPGASSVSERVEALRVFKEAGCRVGVMAMPLLPHISDTEENVRALFDMLLDVGVDFVMPAGLTLRPGRQKDFFLAVIEERFPDLLETYTALYANEAPSGSCVREYSAGSQKRLNELASDYGFPTMIPHSLFKGGLPLYDELFVLLCHMGELYSVRGVDPGRLTRSRNRYREWLLSRKRVFNRRRKMAQEDLEEELLECLRSDRMAQLVGNAKLSAFMREVVEEGKTFDYVQMALV